MKSSEIDISAWYIGVYVREAIVSAFNKDATFSPQPMSVQKRKEEEMTGKDHADRFREFLKHYKRPVRAKPGGEK